MVNGDEGGAGLEGDHRGRGAEVPRTPLPDPHQAGGGVEVQKVEAGPDVADTGHQVAVQPLCVHLKRKVEKQDNGRLILKLLHREERLCRVWIL